MRLLIVSHTAHYERAGAIVGWGPTVREIDHLSRLFDEVVHLAPLHEGPAPASSLPYTSDRVRLRAVQPAGGSGTRAKLGILGRIPQYARAIREECRRADAVHVRCPANISLIACVLLALRSHPRPRWFKYAGNWRPSGAEAWSYTLQRWWLARGLSGGMVTVNGRWPGQRPHVHAFLNPCLTSEEVALAAAVAREKRLAGPVRLLFVGALNPPKGVGRALEVLTLLRRAGLDAMLELVGDGPDRPEFERQAGSLGVADRVSFRGWLPRTELGPVYGRSHVFLFPTKSSEGWPKVLSEAMAHGAVPVAGAVSSIPQILGETGSGLAIDPDDLEGFTKAILGLAEDPQHWSKMSRAAVAAAPAFTYEAYLDAVRGLFGTMGVSLDGSAGEHISGPIREGERAVVLGGGPRTA